MDLQQTTRLDTGKNCGMKHVLQVAFPLIMAAAGHAVNLFSDRVMLARYSAEAVSAAMPAGMTSFSISCVFVGIVSYANTFVAQYTGAGAEKRVGVSIWQAVGFALIGGLLLASGWFWGDALLKLFQHPENVYRQECIYFRVLALGAWIPLCIGAFSAFWSGRGKTLAVMLINFIMVASNIPLNYMFIYGNWGSPELGIRGAAYGTILAGLIGLGLFLTLFFRRENRRRYATWPPKFEWDLWKRLVRYGTPNGIQLLIEISSFNIFIVLLGNVGASDLENMHIQEAATIAFSLNAMAFIPMLGLGQTVSILVGQSVGAGVPAAARRAVLNARLLVMWYMGLMTLFFAFWPDPAMALFYRAGDPGQVETMELARYFLKFIAAFTFFDGIQMLYVSAIKGAGDTAFAMWGSVLIGWLVWIVPSLIAIKLRAPVSFFWSILVLYTFVVAAVFYLRFRQGKWRKMSVIERNLIPRPAE